MITFLILPYASPEHYWDAFFTVQEDIHNASDKNGITEPTAAKVVYNRLPAKVE